MSKISIEFNTDDKSCNVSVDGVPMPKVDGVYLYKRYDSENKYSIELSTYEYDKENEISKTIRVCAEDGTLKKKETEISQLNSVADISNIPVEDISKLLMRG